ncbi:MAG: serine hydrolase, partial [Trichormus sp.]
MIESQGVAVSESGEKLKTFSGRQPVNRRQRSHKVQKGEAKKVKVAHQPRVAAGTAVVTPLENNSI